PIDSTVPLGCRSCGFNTSFNPTFPTCGLARGFEKSLIKRWFEPTAKRSIVAVLNALFEAASRRPCRNALVCAPIENRPPRGPTPCSEPSFPRPLHAALSLLAGRRWMDPRTAQVEAAHLAHAAVLR